MVKKYIDAGIEVARFLKSLKNLVDKGFVKNIDQAKTFAKQEFGEVSDLMTLQINKIFKTKNQPVVGKKDPVFDNTVETIPFDDTGTPFNPRNPQKVYGKPKEGIKTLDEAEMDIKSIDDATNELNDAVTEADAFSENIGFPAATKNIKKETSDLDDILEGLEGDKSLPEIDENLLKNFNDEIKAGVDEIMSDTSPAALRKSIEVDNLMLEYPGLSRDFAKQIANDPDPKRKADMLAMVKQTVKMSEEGKSGSEIIDIFKKGTDRTEQSKGGRIGYGSGTIDPKDSDTTQQKFVSDAAGAIPKIGGGVLPKDMGKLTVDDFENLEDYRRYTNLLARSNKATGGRIGYADGTENMMAEIDYSSSAYKMKLIDSLMDTGGLDYGSAVKEADRIIEIKLRPKTKKKLAAGGLPNILGY